MPRKPSLRPHRKLGLDWSNKDQVQAYHAEWKKKQTDRDPFYFKKKMLKSRFGITLVEFESMREKQSDLCAICGRSETMTHNITGQTVLLSVDHDHKTGKVRELLCGKCNFIIGHAEDNIQILEKAISYLKKHSLEERKD